MVPYATPIFIYTETLLQIQQIHVCGCFIYRKYNTSDIIYEKKKK